MHIARRNGNLKTRERITSTIQNFKRVGLDERMLHEAIDEHDGCASVASLQKFENTINILQSNNIIK